MQPITARDARRLVEERPAQPWLGDLRAAIAHEAMEAWGDTEVSRPTSYFPDDIEPLALIMRILERDGFFLSLSTETLTISWR